MRWALLLLALTAPAGAQEFRYYLFQEVVELRDLLRVCSRELGVAIDYEGEDVQGTIAVDAPEGLSFSGLWALTNRRLADAGLACIRMPEEEALSVVALDTAAGLARVEQGGLEGIRAGYVKLLYSVQFAEPQDLEAALTEVLPEDGSVVATFTGSKHLLISGLRPQVADALRVLDVLDAGPEATAIEEIAVRHVSAIAMAAQLNQVSEKRAAAGNAKLEGSVVANPAGGAVLLVAPRSEEALWRSWIERFDRADAILTRTYTPIRFGLQETAELIEEVVAKDGVQPPGWRLVRDELTGTLLVSAPFGVHEEVDALLRRLDGVDAGARTALRSFPVAYRDAEELLDLLEGLMQAEGQLPDPRGGALEPEETISPRAFDAAQLGTLTITADKDTNRIVAFGETHLLLQLEALLETLDVAHPQVLVEVLVVSLTESEMLDLGVELRYGGETNDLLGEVASLFGLGAPAIADGSIAAPMGSGATGVVLDPGSLAFLVRALEVVNEGRSLTVPKVLVSNHQDATLNSVLQTPYTSTNATNTVATTSLGGTSDAGTSVTVTPHILAADRLRLEYDVSISSFVGEPTDPVLPPPRQENLLQSTVTVPDGYAIVVGGLDMKTEGEAESRVPFLGSLPLLGGLFRSRSTSVSKTRFFVFLRCSVLRSDFRELRYLSDRAKQAAELPADEPVLEPRILR